MYQLVGCRCANCQTTIASIVAGEFCPDCGNPVHNKCKTASTDNPKNCRSCGADFDNPLAAEVRAERANEASRPSPAVLPTPPAPQPPPGHGRLNINKFNLRLVLGGSGAAIFGLWWFIDGVSGGYMNSVIGGLIWKGPLLMAAGAGAIYYGYRMMTDQGSGTPEK